MTTTPFLGLSTYDTASGSSTTFLAYRLSLNGLSSNMTALDAYAQSTSASIAIVKSSSMATINASQISSNYYEATTTAITSYLTNMPINLKLNTTISGSTTLNINGYGVKNVKKIDTAGSIVNVVNGDLIAGRYYLFIYDGTQFVLGGYDASTSGSLSYLYTGSGVITVTGSVVSHNTSGITTGSYNAVYVNQYGHITAGSIVGTGTLTSPFITTGSDSGLSNYRVLTAGSYITITSASTNGGSFIITGSKPGHAMKTTTGVHNQRSVLEFLGAGHSMADSPSTDATQITIPSYTRSTIPPPTTGSWTAINMGTGVFSGANGGDYSLSIKKTSGSDMSLVYYPIDGTSFNQAVVLIGAQTFDFQESGIKFGWMESSSSKIACVSITGNGNFRYEKWNDPTSYSGSYVEKATAMKNMTYMWFRIHYDTLAGPTHRVIEYSINGGAAWTEVYSTLATDFLTPDRWIFGATFGTEQMIAKLFSFEVTSFT